MANEGNERNQNVLLCVLVREVIPASTAIEIMNAAGGVCVCVCVEVKMY